MVSQNLKSAQVSAGKARPWARRTSGHEATAIMQGRPLFGLFSQGHQGGLVLFVGWPGQRTNTDPGHQQGQDEREHYTAPIVAALSMACGVALRMVRQQFQAISSMPLANTAPPARRTM